MSYPAKDIEVLEGLEAVRRRPAMYVGDVRDGSGLHHLLWEVVGNAIDNHLAGHAKTIAVVVERDGSVSITDDGHGIPVEKEHHGRSVVELFLTTLHCGPTFDGHLRHVHVALHGVGLAAVNALTEWFELRVFRGGHDWHQRYERGVAVTALRKVGPARRTGTRIAFKPDPTIFERPSFDASLIARKLRDVAATNPGLETTFVDRRARARKLRLRHPHGLASLVDTMTATRSDVQRWAIRCVDTIDDIAVDVAFKWVDRGQSSLRGFANQLPCDQGTHIVGFRRGLTRGLRELTTASRRAVEDGLVAAVSVQHFHAHFEGPTRAVLANPEVVDVVADLVARATREHFTKHDAELQAVLRRPEARATSAVAPECLRQIASTRSHAPRLVLADSLLERGDPLGDFLTLRCALERETDPERRLALECHCEALERQYRQPWQPVLEALESSGRVRSRRRHVDC